jgi:heme exporter protein B
MSKFFALLKKDLLLELRTKEAVALLLFLTVMLSVSVSIGVANAYIPQDNIVKLYAPMLWVVFMLCAAVALGRTSEYDLHWRALDAVILTGVPAYTIFAAKTVANFIFLSITQLLTLVVLAVLMGVDISADFWSLLLISVLVVFGYAALGTLLSAIASGSRLRSLLLPLIMLPLLFPLLFCAIELSADLLSLHSIALDSFWLSLLVGLDVVYFTVGFNLYGEVIRG